MDAGMKRCTKCETPMSVTQFCKNKKAKDGLQSWCRTCANESSKMSQGMKRAEMAALKSLVTVGQNEYTIGLQRIRDRFDAEVSAHALLHGKAIAAAIEEFKHGSTYLKAKKRVEKLSVRSTESQGVSDHG